MESTTVTVSGKGSNPKTVLYVGGLEEEVTEDVLKSAFVPFGPIKDCNIPLDNEAGKHRGFGFVEYEDKEDAADAIDNMHNAELFGRVLRVNYAQPMRIKGGDKGFSHQAVWADSDRYLEERLAEEELAAHERREALKVAAQEAVAADEGDTGAGGAPAAAATADATAADAG